MYFKFQNITHNVNIETVLKDGFIMIIWFDIFELNEYTDQVI